MNRFSSEIMDDAIGPKKTSPGVKNLGMWFGQRISVVVSQSHRSGQCSLSHAIHPCPSGHAENEHHVEARVSRLPLQHVSCGLTDIHPQCKSCVCACVKLVYTTVCIRHFFSTQMMLEVDLRIA